MSQRSSAEIVKEYNNLAFKAGHLQFEIRDKTADLNAINNTLSALNVEFRGAVEAEKNAAKTEEAPADAQS